MDVNDENEDYNGDYDQHLPATLTMKYIEDEKWKELEHHLESFPESLQGTDFLTGEAPLHAIVRCRNVPAPIVKQSVEHFPDSLKMPDKTGALPIHHAAGHGNVAVLKAVYDGYKEGVSRFDLKGRLPIHVAAEVQSSKCVEFLLEKAPDGAFTLTKPKNQELYTCGDLPIHVACRNYASAKVVDALLAAHFVSAQRSDAKGNLPLHLLLCCGKSVDRSVVKKILAFYPQAVSRTDMNGNLPLAISLLHSCSDSVIALLLTEYSLAARAISGDGHSPLFLALMHDATDRIVMKLLESTPEYVKVMDEKSGLLPIQFATKCERSHFLVYQLLLRDLPVDLDEKTEVKYTPHKHSWFHIVSRTSDLYYPVVQKILTECSQPQVVALAKADDGKNKSALESATPICRYEIRVAMRLFNTLEVTDPNPAYSDPVSETQILFALKFPQRSANESEELANMKLLHDDNSSGVLSDFLENLDDADDSIGSVESQRSALTEWSLRSIQEKIDDMRNEKGMQVVVKFTTRRDIMEREINVRKLYRLSRFYVPAILSVHHTVQHEALDTATQQGYCITMEGADMTLENMLPRMHQSDRSLDVKALKRIGISLLHLHERGLVHGDFGPHNVGKFRNRWKLLGVGGSVPIGEKTDPNRGFFLPPEAIKVISERNLIIKKSYSSSVKSIVAHPTFDIWAYGAMLYEVLSGKPLSIYTQPKEITDADAVKIGKWDERALKKALKGINGNLNACNLLACILQANPDKRLNTMREVLMHPFFERSDCDNNKKITTTKYPPASRQTNGSEPSSLPFEDKSSHIQTQQHLLRSIIESCEVSDH